MKFEDQHGNDLYINPVFIVSVGYYDLKNSSKGDVEKVVCAVLPNNSGVFSRDTLLEDVIEKINENLTEIYK